MNFTIFERPVAPRARRIALIVASVPEETQRTASIEGTASVSTSARRTSPSVGAPNEDPAATAFVAADTMAGWAWPAISGPQEHT